MANGNITYNRRKELGLCVRCGCNLTNQTGRKILACKDCDDKQRSATKQWMEHTKSIVYKFYGNECACCGESESKFLQLDHINNDGGLKRRSKRSEHCGPALYSHIIRKGFPSDIQLLCANCNWGKRMNEGVCPHKTKDL